ncbi:ABC transporter substrate-binding protein [Acholeplasma hippikon]|uniref:Putrescine-binding periplasmic protein n=1 Tax=Acholeplasma hippikon TaxID=264636 RepID=A0A449BK12_9MOLU|nr:ABC transporter substrate-binding protein [Acholeplasma hippikon]VEU82789.1 Putrescine-binding periplasmic protein precursor [Acholeplasma hippikon]
MKKILTLAFTFLSILFLTSCNTTQKLLILNWGEYINEDLVLAFEEEFNVEVSISIADSNELFYSKVKSGTTAYDLVLPSDYMIAKMVDEKLIQPIQFDKLSNYDPENNPYMQGLQGIINTMEVEDRDYFVPYFWGSFGLMYNKRVAGLEEALHEHGWAAYFEPSKRPTNRVGMYDVAQYAYSTAMLYHHISPLSLPETVSEGQTLTNLELARQTLKAAKFTVFADDQLKKDIQSNNLDLAYVWTGDFLDVLYVDLDEGMNYDEKLYDIYIPENTMAFMDAFVIPTKARHVDLAHEFINFFLNPDNAYENAGVVGYATPLQQTYDAIAYYEGDDEWLTSWARAQQDYYPDTGDFHGVPYANFSNEVLSRLLNMLNDVKTSK